MSFEETKKRALRMLERRDYGSAELVSKLMEKGEPAGDSQAVVDRLCQLGVIDDRRFASMLVRNCAAKGYGPARARDELYRRRIPRELWDEALSELPEPDETLDRLLISRLRGGDVSDRAALKKATDALRRRGFGWSEISAAVERLRANYPEY